MYSHVSTAEKMKKDSYRKVVYKRKYLYML